MYAQTAREVYDTLIHMLDTRDWKYDKIEDKLMIKSGIKGEDLPIQFLMIVEEDREVVQFISSLPFNMPEDKRVDGAIAVCVANYGLCNGSFDYDISDGEIRFRMTTTFKGGSISEDALEHMILVAAGTIDDYNDKFFMVAKNMMSIQDFIEKDGE